MIIRKIRVDDIQSNGRAEHARKALFLCEGVVKVITLLDDQAAEVTYDEGKTSLERLLKALTEAGFQVPAQPH